MVGERCHWSRDDVRIRSKCLLIKSKSLFDPRKVEIWKESGERQNAEK